MIRKTTLLAISFVPLLLLSSRLSAEVPAGNGVQPELLHAFSVGVGDWQGNVVAHSDGNFYGLSRTGGSYNHGTFFRITPSGATTVLASFGDPSSDARGTRPNGTLVWDGVSHFYGVTEGGGRFFSGTAFRVTLAGAVETLVDFDDDDEGVVQGGYPNNGMTLGSDGDMYGMVAFGGSTGRGFIFRISPQGRYQKVVEFTGDSGAAPGGNPFACGMVSSGGSLIGVTSGGGKYGAGVVFRLTTDGVYTVLGDFNDPAGVLPGGPVGAPVVAAGGVVYGPSLIRDNYTYAVWKLPVSGPPSLLAKLDMDLNGNAISTSRVGLAFENSGSLLTFADYVAAFGGAGFVRISTAGVVTPVQDISGVTVSFGNFVDLPNPAIVSDGAGGFIAPLGNSLIQYPASGPVSVLTTAMPDGGTGEGSSPVDAPAIKADGTIFGRTSRGGTSDYGTLYARPPGGGSLTVLRAGNDLNSYYSYGDVDNYSPLNSISLPLTAAGDVMVTNLTGGAHGEGYISRFSAAGTEILLADFDSSVNGLINPTGGLVPDGAGNYYGRAFDISVPSGVQAAAIYKLDASNQISKVATFPAASVSSYTTLAGALTFDGTRLLAVDYNHSDRIYAVTPSGQISTLFEFSKAPFNGFEVAAPFLVNPSGDLTFPVEYGGADERGFLARLVHGSTKPTSLVDFTDGNSDDTAIDIDGKHPSAPLASDATGRIFGVTLAGGDSNLGVIYRLDPDNSYHTLHYFRYDSPPGGIGGIPSAGLTRSGNYLYGSTLGGGPLGGGTLFRFPVSPTATATTGMIVDFTANSAVFVGSVQTNGYGGEYWYTYVTAGDPALETAHQSFGGALAAQDASFAFTGLKGHRTYEVHLMARAGVGADIASSDGGAMSVRTPNGAPVLGDDTILGDSDGTFIGDVLDNDIEPDDDTLRIVSVTNGTSGTAEIFMDEGKQKIRYTPNAGFTGIVEDTISYTVTDDYAGADGPLTAVANVTILGTERTIGAYAGLLVEEPAGANIPRDAAATLSANQIAAGFANFAISKGRGYSARFEPKGHKPVVVKGTMSASRGTTFSGRDFSGSFRPVAGAAEARITVGGRTLIMRAGQAFGDQPLPPQPKSDFTMRFTPDQMADPVSSAGLPAGSGYAVVRQTAKGRSALVGVLPDGTPFSKASVIDGQGVMPYLALLYKGKTGSLDGKISITPGTGEIDPAGGTTTHWTKSSNSRDKRFVSGFSTTLTPYGGKYEVPTKQPPFALGSSKLVATFDRGGLFVPLLSKFTFTGVNPVVEVATDTAHAKPVFNARTGLVKGTFIPFKKPVKFNGVVVQRDHSVAGFFLGMGDTGTVDMNVVP